MATPRLALAACCCLLVDAATLKPRPSSDPLLLNILPGVDISLATTDHALLLGLKLRADDTSREHSEEAPQELGKSFSSSPFMMLGPMITYGMFPFMFANLNMLVMKAVMMNNMALSMAVFNLIRDVVFGPHPGPKVVYKNYGYRRKSRPQAPVYHGPHYGAVHHSHLFQDKSTQSFGYPDLVEHRPRGPHVDHMEGAHLEHPHKMSAGAGGSRLTYGQGVARQEEQDVEDAGGPWAAGVLDQRKEEDGRESHVTEKFSSTSTTASWGDHRPR